ncbi:MAG: helix-turn-helix domain-containing protein [Anaerolineae bacterium]
MTESMYMTPADIERENIAIELINLVVDEGMTIKDAVEEVGIGRSTWYYWVEHGKVDHLLRKKHEEVMSRLDLNSGGSD